MNQVRYGAINYILRMMLYPWLSRVRSLNQDLKFLQDLQEKGQLIFVGNVASFIDFMVVNDLLKRHGIAPLHFTHGINPFMVLPFPTAWRYWWGNLFKRDEVQRKRELKALWKEFSGIQNGMVFLKQSHRFWDSKDHYYRGFFGKLARYGQDDRQVFLVPTSVFLTRMRKKNAKRTFYEIFLGSYDYPGRFRKFTQLLLNYRKGGAIFSKAIDVREAMAQSGKSTDEAREKRLRWTLLFHLNNEDRAYRGPNKRSRSRKVRRILRERRLNEELKQVAERTGRSFDSVYKEALRNLHEIASDTSESVVNILRILFDFVWARTVEGIDVKREDVHRIRELTKKGPIVVLPCHRSHVDYLLLGYLFEKEGLNYPRTAAGDNLSKWPLGAILRRAGAFFLRRSFKGETIFPLVFDAYIRHILRERHVLLFFIEGGRSRTGKLLHPKMGMMSMLLDAWRQGVIDDLPLVPITVDYGKVFEGGAYLREKSGEEKRSEGIASVLRSRKVLGRKHGIIRVRFSEPIFLKQYLADKGHTRDTLGFKARIPLINQLSFDVLSKINEKVTLTAGNVVAGLLMGNHRRGITLSELRTLFVISIRYLHHQGAEITFTEPKLEIALQNALQTFEQWETLVRVEVGGEVVVNIPENKRSEMEYYKNNGLHYILHMALFSMALRCLPPQDRVFSKINEFCRQVYGLLEMEFLFQDPYPEASHIQEAYAAMERIDALCLENDRIVLGEYRIGHNLLLINAYLLLNFLESYLVVAEVISDLGEEANLDKKQLLKQCMNKAKLLYAVGTIRRPESKNHVTFANALNKFSRDGYLKFRSVKGQKQPIVQVNAKKTDAFMATKNRLFQWINHLN